MLKIIIFFLFISVSRCQVRHKQFAFHWIINFFQTQTSTPASTATFVNPNTQLIVENILKNEDKTPEEAEAFRKYAFTVQTDGVTESDVVKALVEYAKK